MATTINKTLGDHGFADLLADALNLAESEGELDHIDGALVSSFADSGVLTNNAGLVVRLGDGSEFQVTVVRSR